MELFDEKDEELRGSFEKLIDFLEKQGVPNEVKLKSDEGIPNFSKNQYGKAV